MQLLFVFCAIFKRPTSSGLHNYKRNVYSICISGNKHFQIPLENKFAYSLAHYLMSGWIFIKKYEMTAGDFELHWVCSKMVVQNIEWTLPYFYPILDIWKEYTRYWYRYWISFFHISHNLTFHIKILIPYACIQQYFVSYSRSFDKADKWRSPPRHWNAG